MAAARPFRAFVSYSHADSAFAAWLQRKLEGYRLPRRLAGQVAPLPGQAQGRIGPVFRDRADLSAATDLSAAVREGIAASSALVVVASPDAARSQWVEREIALFRQLHPEAPILVALARGEPAEALPEALRSADVEPLCADFRKQGDGRRLAFLKIVAGLAGLPLDALVQRDAQRQMRRVTGVTFGTAVLVVIMALLLVMALRAREEAEHRRAGAEGLVKFMLTSLRGRLKEVGNLEIMHSTNEQALRYFDDQDDPTKLSDDSILLRALVLHALGEDDANRGDLPAALDRFREAHRATSAVLRRQPTNREAIYAHAQSEYWMGYQAWLRNDLKQAEIRWLGYLRHADALAQVEGRTRRSMMELGYANGNLCQLKLRHRTDIPGAVAYCRASARDQRAALAARPDGNLSDSVIRVALANRLGWLADALNEARDYSGALRARRAEEELVGAALARNPRDADLRDRAIWPRIGMGNIEIARGRTSAGLALLKASLRDLEALHREFPDNQAILGRRVRVALLIAQALRRSGERSWQSYRDLAAGVLAEAAARGQSREAMARFYEMLAKLDDGRLQ